MYDNKHCCLRNFLQWQMFPSHFFLKCQILPNVPRPLLTRKKQVSSDESRVLTVVVFWCLNVFISSHSEFNDSETGIGSAPQETPGNHMQPQLRVSAFFKFLAEEHKLSRLRECGQSGSFFAEFCEGSGHCCSHWRKLFRSCHPCSGVVKTIYPYPGYLLSPW